jgi:hypothetical protein
MATTIRAALPFAAGRGAAGPATPVLLTRGVLRAMFLDRLKWAAVVLVGVAALGAGIAWGVSAAADHRPRAGQPDAPLPDQAKKAGPDDWRFPDVNKDDPIYLSRRCVVVGVDAKGKRILVRLERGTSNAPFAIAPKAKMSFTAPVTSRSPVSHKMGFADIRKGMVLDEIDRSEDGRTFVSFACAWPLINGKVTAVDREKRTLTIDKASLQGSQDVGVFRARTTFSVAPKASVVVDGPNTHLFLLDLRDVPPGRAVALDLNRDRSVRLIILDATGDVSGAVRSTDAARRLVRVALKQGEATVELALELKKDATIRLGGKAVVLGDLKAEMPVLLRLDADRRTVVGLWALPPPR